MKCPLTASECPSIASLDCISRVPHDFPRVHLRALLLPTRTPQSNLPVECAIGSRPYGLRSRRARYPSRCQGELGDAAGHPEAADAQPGHDLARAASQPEHGRVSTRRAPESGRRVASLAACGGAGDSRLSAWPRYSRGRGSRYTDHSLPSGRWIRQAGVWILVSRWKGERGINRVTYPYSLPRCFLLKPSKQAS